MTFAFDPVKFIQHIFNSFKTPSPFLSDGFPPIFPLWIVEWAFKK